MSLAPQITGRPSQPVPHRALPIRSAERRRWTADLLRDETTCLVLYGATGIGKSMLAHQVVQRARRLRPDARLTAIDGFEPGTRDITAIPGKLVITSRAPFTSKRRGTIFRRVGPLTRSGAGELASSLENLRDLSGAELDRVWRLAAGHPQAMKDLDARLRGADFTDVALKLSAAITAVTGWTADRLEPTELPADAAETIAAVATAFLAPSRNVRRICCRSARFYGRLPARRRRRLRRLLITLAALLQRQPVTVSSFGDSGRDAEGDVPFRSATIVGADQAATAFFAAQLSPFRPRRLIATRDELVVQFDVATSFGLLEG